MTLPGPEDGHLRMPNWLVERLARLRLNGTQWQILWAVWRRTLCWQKSGQWGNRPWPIGTPELANACGINAHQVKREMSSLVKLNIITRDNTPGGRGHKPTTAFNLEPSTWNIPAKSSEIATLNKRVTEEIPITEQKGSERVTPTMEEVEEKGSELVTPSVADSLPFTNRSATLSVPKSKLLNKHLNKHAKETYSAVFNHWNTLQVVKHKKITDRMMTALKSALKNYSQEEICRAIGNYAEIVHGPEYYWEYRWTLEDFLQRGLEKFMDAEVAQQNYRRREEGKHDAEGVTNPPKRSQTHKGESPAYHRTTDEERRRAIT